MDKYEQNLARQLEMNAATWQRLQAHGVAPGMELTLDFFFDSPEEARAGELLTALQAKGYEARVCRTGSWFRRAWHVEGSTPSLPVTLDWLNEWAREMVAIGRQFECHFDGWGAALPAS